jgi:hypothetical protein
MKLRIFAVFLSLLALNVNAETQPLEPLNSLLEKRPRWTSDETEIAYVSVRCGTLFWVIGEMFSVSKKQGDEQTGRDLKIAGLKLIIFGNELSKIDSMSEEVRNRRQELLAKAYGDAVKNNRSLHNNMFYGFVEHDFRRCKEIEQMLLDAATRANPKSK